MNINKIKNNPSVYKLGFKIRSYEVDYRGFLKPVVLCFLLQETASYHAATASVDITDLLNDDKTWMLSRLMVDIIKYPGWRDEIKIYTWPVGVKGLFAVRDFVVVNHKDDILAFSTSSWLIVDINRRRPVRVEKFIDKMILLPDIRAINTYIVKPDFPEVNYKETGRDKVTLDDIDINRHLTSMKFIQKVLDNFYEDVLKNALLSKLFVYFNSEALLNESLIIETGGEKDIRTALDEDRDVFFHRVVRKSDRKELCKIKSEWRVK